MAATLERKSGRVCRCVKNKALKRKELSVKHCGGGVLVWFDLEEPKEGHIALNSKGERNRGNGGGNRGHSPVLEVVVVVVLPVVVVGRGERSSSHPSR